MSNEFKSYLKCHFCRVFHKNTFKKCSIYSLKKGKLCYYGTLLSVWKWFVRTLSALGGSVLLLWYFIFGLKYLKYANDEIERTAFQMFAAILAGLVSISLVIAIIFLIIYAVLKVNNAFRDSAGVYFKKDRTRYDINEED